MGIDKNELFENNQKLAAWVAHKYFKKGKSGMEFEDLHQEALIGLYKAAERFDCSKGTRFSTYATPYIQGAVLDYLGKQNLLKTSRNVIEAATKIRKQQMQNWDAEKIAHALDISINTVERAFVHMTRPKEKSLSEPASYVDKEYTVLDMLADNTSHHDDCEIEFKLFQSALGPKEQRVLQMRSNGFTQSEIAKVVGVSQVEISRILQRTKRKYEQFIS